MWEAVLPQLRSRRAQRRQPARDDKVVAAWNAQAVQSVATAGALWEDPQALQLAESLGERLWGTHAQPAGAHEDPDRPQIRISRTSYAGVAGPNPGTLSDHAHTAHACFTLASTGALAHQWAERGLAVLRFVLTEFVADHNGELQVLDALDAEGLLAKAQDGAAEATPVDGPEPSSIAALVQALQIAEALGHSSRLPDVGDRGKLTPQDLLHHLPVVIPKAPLAVGSSLLGARRAVLGSPAFRVFSAAPTDLAEVRRRGVLHGVPTEPVDPGAVGQGRPLQVSICLNSPAAAVCLAPSSSVDSALAELD